MQEVVIYANAYLALYLVIVTHELGHYAAGRILGLAVSKFSIGGDIAVMRFYYGGTLFKFSPIAISGYVAFIVFSNTPGFKRLLVALAGPAINVLVGVVILLFSPGDFLGRAHIIVGLLNLIPLSGFDGRVAIDAFKAMRRQRQKELYFRVELDYQIKIDEAPGRFIEDRFGKRYQFMDDPS